MKLFQTPIVLLAFLVSLRLSAQDSSKTFSAAQVVQAVLQYHPIALQAANNVAQARAGITSARGLFDPVLEMETAEKRFDGMQYYRYAQPQIIIPTWYGISLYAGTENLSGARTNPEETKGRTSYAGISLPVLKNLLLDGRRAALQQAKILEQQSEAEKKMALNDLLRDALHTYWNWVQQHLLKSTIDRLVATNEKRLAMVKTAVRVGERPAIDTLEALTQWQTLLNQQQEQHVALQNATLDLSLFLWTRKTEPWLLPANVLPASLPNFLHSASLQTTDSLLLRAHAEHPELLQYQFKITFLEVEKRLKFQSLLPKLDIKYNQLGKGYNVAKTAAAPLLQHNYRYGISFSLPLRLSEGRGAYQAAKLKIKNTELELAQKTALIDSKIKTYSNKLQGLQAQINLQQQVLENTKALQRAEEQRFFSGESSLFLINSRENKVLETGRKVIELQTKWAQAYIDRLWAAGLLPENRDINQ